MGWGVRLNRLTAETWLRQLSFGIVFLALIQVLTIALSLSHVVISQPVALVVMLGAMGGAWGLDRLFYHRRDDRTAGIEPSPPIARAYHWAVVILIPLLGFAVVNAYLHPYLFADCAIYHLPAIHFWGERGFVHWIHMKPGELFYTDWFINGYPKAAELMGFVVIRATGIAGLVHLLNVWFLWLGFSGVAFMSRRLGVSAAGSLVAGLVFALAPVHLQQMNGTYVDSAFSSAIVALLAVLVAVATDREGSGRYWHRALIFGACAGLVLGIKGSGPLPVGSVGIAAVILLGRRMRGLPVEERRQARLRLAGWLLVVLGVALVVGGYWYVRNVIHMGNPLYPLAVRIGSFLRLPGLTPEFVLNEAANIPMATAGWPDWVRVLYVWGQGGLAHWPLSLCSVSGRLGGLGLIWLLGCLPAMAFLALPAKRTGGMAEARKPAMVLLVTASFIFLLTPMHWWARYTLWLLGVGLPCLFVVLERKGSGRRHRWATCWAGVLALVFLLETLIGLSWIACAEPVDWYGGSMTFPSQPKISVRQLSWARPVIPVKADDRGAVFGELSREPRATAIGPLNEWKVLSDPLMGVFGVICDPLGRRPVFLLDQEKIFNPRKMRVFLQQNDVRHVVWDAQVKCPPMFDRLARKKEETGALRYFSFDWSPVPQSMDAPQGQVKRPQGSL